MTPGAWKFPRHPLFILGGALLTLYVAVFALMLYYQRDLLFLGSRHAIAPPPPGSIYQLRTIAESDGTRLAIWQAPRAGAATVVFFYGNGGTLADFSRFGEVMHARGFGVVLASYRGYSGNPGRPSEAGLMADARAILAAIPKPHGHLILWGHSLGSGIAARMAAEGRCAALILESPYTAISEVAARRYPMFPVRWFMEDRFDTLSLVPRIKVPVLIMSGTDDHTIPFDMGLALSNSFGPRAEFAPFLGADHDLAGIDVVGTVDAWMRANAIAAW